MNREPEVESRWTVLPPLPLRGLGTSAVESLSHYLRRLAWVSGSTVSRLMAYSNSELVKDQSNIAQERYDLTLGRPEHRIFSFERLVGLSHLRYGTFWVLKNVAGPHFLGGALTHRRWCSTCYAEWDVETSYEPLMWSVRLASACPRHGRRLSEQCSVCEASQFTMTSLDRRYHCQECGSPLADSINTATLSDTERWTDLQIGKLIEMCSTMGEEPLLEEPYQTFLDGINTRLTYSDDTPACLTSARRIQNQACTPRKPSLRTLLQICALQSVSICDLLQAPRAAATDLLFDTWHDGEARNLRHVMPNTRIAKAHALVKRLFHRCASSYLPPIDVVVHEFGTNRTLMRDVDADLYERYERQFRAQASYVLRLRLSDAFIYAIRSLADMPTSRLRRRLLWNDPAAIAKSTHMSQQEAEYVFFSALIYTRLRRRLLHRRSDSA
ncbi:TniQ family protein [Dyella dinghuensis]